jgi:radical SAM protein with 4Fe4S-binding SPASM domain
MLPSDFENLCHQFDAMGGLRLLVSGGEPLAHPQWEELNAVLAEAPFRRVLLSNGQTLDEETTASLSVDAVQLSIDGLKKGHEAVRGSGTFDKVLQAATNVLNSGLDLSIATMAHAMNLEEFEQMATFVQELGATEWSIDAPCVAGRLEEHLSLQITPQQAAKAMRCGFGGAYHGGNKDMACGLHLATVGADGLIAQCGFYFDNPLGTVGEGLESVWARREALTLDSVEGCRSCKVAEVCGGGCRYRAESLTVPDAVMCELHGIV